MAGKTPKHGLGGSDDEQEVIGYATRMKLITELHKEHNISEHTKEELTTDDPNEVYEYKRTQQIKNFTTGTKRRDEMQGAPQGMAQVFRKLDLMPIETIQLSSKGGRGVRTTQAQQHAPEPDAKDDRHHRQLTRRTRNKKREAEKPIEIIIPLANDRVKTTSIHTDKALHIEYAVRYLEKLGVSPTPANLALVSKHIPLEQCKIQQVFHPGLSKHEKKNYIVLRPNQRNAGKTSSSVYDPQNIPFEALPDNLIQKADERDKERERELAEKRREEAKSAADQGQQGDGDEATKQVAINEFSEYRERYLFPYNLKGKHSGRVTPDLGGVGDEPQARMNVLQLAMQKHRPDSRGTGAGTPQPTQKSPRPGAASSTSGRNKTPETEVEEGMDGAMTEQRLKLQDGLIALLKKHEAAASEAHTQFQQQHIAEKGTTGEDALDEFERRDSKREQLRGMEARAIDGDLTALDEHPDMERMGLVLDEDTSAEADRRRKNKSQATSIGTWSPLVSPSHAQSPFADSPTVRTNVGQTKENPMARELAAAPTCSAQQIRTLFQAFVQGFPFPTFWAQRERAEMIPERKQEYDAKVKIISADLQSDAMVNFQMQFTLFIYHSLIVPCAEHVVGPAMYNTRAPKRSTIASSSHLHTSPGTSQLDPYHHLRHPPKSIDFDQAFLDVYQRMLDLLLRKRKRQCFSLDLPVTVLAIRVVTEALVNFYYPLFAATELGADLLHVTNVFVTQLLDPVGFLTHVPAVESAPQALKVMHKKRIPARMPLSFTSPVVRFIVGEARSNEAKVLLASGAGGAGAGRGKDDDPRGINIFALLSPAVRSKLLAIISNHRLALRPFPSKHHEGEGGGEDSGDDEKHENPFRPPRAPMIPSQNALKRASLALLHPGGSAGRGSATPLPGSPRSRSPSRMSNAARQSSPTPRRASRQTAA